MRTIVVLVDLAGAGIDDTAWELATAARGAGDARVVGIVLGSNLSPLLPELTRWFDEVISIDDERLAPPDGDFASSILAPLLERVDPFCVMAAHTNHSMDYVPALAVRLDRPLLTDCLSIDLVGETIEAVRPAFGGRIHARVSTTSSDTGYFATMRPGSVRPGECPEASGTVRKEAIPVGATPRRRFIETVAGDAGEIDISQAERLVAVGRGIEDQESLEMIEELARALGAEVACSRPIVDKQWLPKSRQVGTSGKTVKPKVYLAVGISGSFQHIGGVKGDPFLAAVNKDPRAPIFSVADVGVVADLYDFIPILTGKIQSLKG